MLINEIKTGMQAQIMFRSTAGKMQGPYNTRVEMVDEDNTLLLHAPMEKGRRIRFTDQNVYRLYFILANSQINFETRLVGETRVEHFDMLRFEIVGDGEKIQRRRTFRFACTMPIQFNIVYDNGEQSEIKKGVVRDLSGGGIKMTSKESIPENALLRFDMHLDGEYIMAFGLIKLKRHTPENSRYPYTYGISFEGMPEKDEEYIVRYVYNEQRKLLRKPQSGLYTTVNK